jgi:hypothetical protein
LEEVPCSSVSGGKEALREHYAAGVSKQGLADEARRRFSVFDHSGDQFLESLCVLRTRIGAAEFSSKGIGRVGEVDPVGTDLEGVGLVVERCRDLIPGIRKENSKRNN